MGNRSGGGWQEGATFLTVSAARAVALRNLGFVASGSGEGVGAPSYADISSLSFRAECLRAALWASSNARKHAGVCHEALGRDGTSLKAGSRIRQEQKLEGRRSGRIEGRHSRKHRRNGTDWRLGAIAGRILVAFTASRRAAARRGSLVADRRQTDVGVAQRSSGESRILRSSAVQQGIDRGPADGE